MHVSEEITENAYLPMTLDSHLNDAVLILKKYLSKK